MNKQRAASMGVFLRQRKTVEIAGLPAISTVFYLRLSELLLNHHRKLVDVLVDLRLIRPFDHHADERLRA